MTAFEPPSDQRRVSMTDHLSPPDSGRQGGMSQGHPLPQDPTIPPQILAPGAYQRSLSSPNVVPPRPLSASYQAPPQAGPVPIPEPVDYFPQPAYPPASPQQGPPSAPSSYSRPQYLPGSQSYSGPGGAGGLPGYAPPPPPPPPPPPAGNSMLHPSSAYDDGATSADRAARRGSNDAYAQRPRAYSSSSHHSHRSSRTGTIDEEDIRRRRHSTGRHSHRSSSGSRKRQAEKRPTYGDTVMLAWNSVKDLLSSRRD